MGNNILKAIVHFIKILWDNCFSKPVKVDDGSEVEVGLKKKDTEFLHLRSTA